MENKTSFVLLAHLMPEFLCFSRWRAVAILDLEARISTLYNNNLSRFVMPDLLKVDTFCISSTFGATEIQQFIFYKPAPGVGGHLNFAP